MFLMCLIYSARKEYGCIRENWNGNFYSVSWSYFFLSIQNYNFSVINLLLFEIDINTWVELLGLKSSKFELPLFEESKIYMDIYRKDTNYKKERIILFHRSEPNKPPQRHDYFIAFASTGSFTYRLY